MFVLILQIDIKKKLMKKIFFLFSTLLLVLTSCSSDEQEPMNPDPIVEKPDPSLPIDAILPVKTMIIGSDGTSVFSSDIVYDGNKIVSITGQDGRAVKYSYVGNFIAKIEETVKTSGNSFIHFTTEYNYDDGKLVNSIQKGTASSTYHYTTRYTYNSDGTVSYDHIRTHVSSGAASAYGTIGKYTLKDGNLVKEETSNSIYGSSDVIVYEYDTKNNPFKNVLGFNLLFDNESVNNLIKKTSVSVSGTNVSESITTYTNKYDANDFLTERVSTFEKEGSAFIETIQFVY